MGKYAGEKLAVAEARLGGAIKAALGIECEAGGDTNELLRCIRANFHSLVADVAPADERAMALGLAHTLSRFKLKFSPDKIDTMIVQAIALLDDLDKVSVLLWISFSGLIFSLSIGNQYLCYACS